MLKAVAIIYGLFTLALILHAITPKDNSDPPGFWSRSGMALYTDHLSGCQYLRGSLFGGLTPRMDSDGKQVCDPDLRNKTQ
jgi:hypothetical protein